MKKLFILAIVALLAIGAAGCGTKATNETNAAKESSELLKVGVTAGPHEQVMEKVKELAEKQGLKIQIVSFTDYVQPNVQLNEKQIDVNVYQHEPYLDQFNKDHKMNLVKVASAVNFPMGIYSSKLKSLDDLKKGNSIALPSDPTNEARALLLFQSAKVIKLKDGVGVKATIKDITDNPKEIKFIETDAPTIPRALGDVDAAAINTNYAMDAGLNPVKDSIFIEPKDSPWVNIIVARPDNKDDKKISKFIEIYHSEEVKKFIEDNFKGSVIPAF